MEISSLLFALGLFSAGIWLVLTINGEFKGRQRREQRFPPTLHGHQPLARQTRTARRPARARPALQPAPTVKIGPVANEQQSACDKWQALDASVVYKSFEKFTRE